MYKLIILLAIIASLGSCQKKTDSPVNAKVSFTVTSPAAGQVYRAGDSVAVKASITYAGELHGYEVKITDTTSGYIVYDNAQHVHSDHFDVATAYVAAGTQPLGLKLELIAEVDHNGNTQEQVVRFMYLP